MKATKKVVGELEKCYSLAVLNYQGKDHFLCAAEKQNECYLISLDGEIEDTVWEGPGGVMTMIQMPKGAPDGQFLATRKFYSPNDGKEASIIICTPKGKGDWEVRTLCTLPFVHRFGILQSHGKNYLIACALKSDAEYRDDWRFPGKVFGAELPTDLSAYGDGKELELKVLKEDLLKNHGYYVHEDGEGQTSAIVSTDNGVFQFVPPASDGAEWTIETLTTDAASDGLLVDLNGDGVEELCTIAPFHGDTVNIYRKEGGKFVLDYTYPEKLEFLHAICADVINGKPYWFLGNRKGNRDLLAFSYDKEQGYHAEKLDEGYGAANVLMYHLGDKNILMAANRESNEIARYEISC